MRPFIYTCCALVSALLLSPIALAQNPGADRIATLLGGSGEDVIEDMAVAADGTVYVVGTTESANFPATDGAFDTTLGGEADAFVARFSENLTTLLAATYLGGDLTVFDDPASDRGYGLAVSDESVFVVGQTGASDFPVTSGAFQDTNKSGDAFVARLSLDLSSLEAATYFGADDSDVALDVALDFEGDVVFAGVTDGPNFPLSDGAYSPNSGPVEGPFVTRLSPALTELRASTRFNGSGDVNGLAVDPVTGDVAILGTTSDKNYPATPGAFDTTCGTDGDCNFVNPFIPLKSDAFISRMSRDGTTLVASTYLGGEEFDYGFAMAWVGGEIVIAGATESQAFPVSGDAFQTFHANGALVGYVARFDETLSTLSRSTTFSGTVSRDPAYIRDLYVEPDTGDVHVAGWTRANDLPLTSDAFDQGFTGQTEQFYSVFDADLSELTFSSFLGGTDPSSGDGPLPSVNTIAVGADGSLYVAGAARAVDFFTSEDAYQTDVAGRADGFVARLIEGNTVANEGTTQPDETALLASYPNPFVSTSTVRFQTAEAGDVRLAVYDVRGREVAVLVDRVLPGTVHEAQFDAAGLASGTYFVRLASGAVVQTQTLTLIR